ncbi:hypothetical protein V7112_16350 [Bacillus sp. JJ1566]|uniref:hypothetical protein n=1 Tax=Bacillus sp. JJ1566 TaxID=3122961 RepID=UPI00300045B3
MTGCLSPLDHKEQYIKIQKRVGNEYNYVDFKEITDNEQVQKVKKILDKADWEKAKVEMAYYEDFQFIFQHKNSEDKAVLYRLWINNARLALVRGNDGYVQLNEDDSAVLREILVGEG